METTDPGQRRIDGALSDVFRITFAKPTLELEAADNTGPLEGWDPFAHGNIIVAHGAEIVV